MLRPKILKVKIKDKKNIRKCGSMTKSTDWDLDELLKWDLLNGSPSYTVFWSVADEIKV